MTTKPTIGILYVGIGPYIRLWDDFYSTCKKNFCPELTKHYYVVTDAQIEHGEDVTLVHQDNLGWPCNVVFRYLFFLRIKELLAQYDYLFFFNGNTRFRKCVAPEEFLPTEEEGGLIALTWQQGTENPDNYGFERRPESAAYTPFGTKSIYLQSGITGGRTTEYLQLLERCHDMTMADFQKGIIPVSHDESIYNKYMVGRPAKLISSLYGKPSQRDRGHTAKIVFQRKEDILGRSWLRRYKNRPHTNTWFRKLLRKLGLVS